MIVLLLVGLGVYLPGLSGGFVFDDFGNIVDNAAMAPAAVHADFWRALWSNDSGPTHRPITILTFILQEWFTGLTPWPLKLVNVLIHLGNGMLLFFLSRRVVCWVFTSKVAHLAEEDESGLWRCDTGGNTWLVSPNLMAFLIAAAWLLAPIQLTGVLYVVQRMESLATLFVLLGLLLYWTGRVRLIAGRNGAWWRIWGALTGITVIATLAKESGVMLPLYAFLLELGIFRWRGAGGFEFRLMAVFALVLVIPGVAGLFYTLPSALNGSAYANRMFDLPERLWTEGRVMIDYLHWIVAPTPNDLSLYHDDISYSTGWFSPWTTAAGWALIAGLLATAVWFRKRAPLYSLGILWFFAGQLLVSTWIPLELVYEHRNYLPSWGVFLALFGVIFGWVPKDGDRASVLRTLMLSGTLGVIAMYAGFTAIRAQIWGNPYRLAYFESTTHPDSPRASYDLARIMMILAPDTDSPLFHMGMAQMAKTAKLPGASLQAEQAMIFMAAKNHLKINDDWWVELRDKIARQPISSEDVAGLYSLINCGTNGVCEYDKEALTRLGEILAFAKSRYPTNAEMITLYANYAANLTHDFPLAYSLMQRAVVLKPNKFDYWNNLVTMQIAKGELSSAQAGIERMKELNGIGAHDAEINAAEIAMRLKSISLQKRTDSSVSDQVGNKEIRIDLQ